MPLSHFDQGKIGSRYLNAFVDALNSVLALKADATRVPALAGAAPVNAVASALTTALAGANNDMVFTAKTKGTAGDAITIAYLDPGVETAAESVAVVGTAIAVTLRSVGGVLSTAAQVKAAIEANATANALVSIAYSGADTGAAAVTALVATPLAGGVNGTVGTAYEQRYHSGWLYYVASATGNTIADANWKKWQVATV